jgi:soluble lytic murein transglycosylase
MPRRALAAVAALSALLFVVPAPPAAADPAALRAALDRAEAGDWAGARAAVAGAGEIAADIIEWQRLRAGEAGGGTLADYRAFLARRSDWPGLPLLAEKGERTIPRDAAPEVVLDYFRTRLPATGRGALRLAAARAATGDRAGAEAEIVRAWTTLTLDAEEQAAFLERHGAWVAPHHAARLEAMLWRGAVVNARAMLPHVPADLARLAEARIGLREEVNGVDALIAAVPEALRDDPGLAFERFAWRARKGRNADAVALALERSVSAEALGEPARWAPQRAELARWLLREGRAREAYRLAADHHLDGGRDYAELEWLAGFAALRFLNDPERAISHFRRLRAAVETPISLGRAGYWEGRAREAAGDRAGALAAYEFAGEHQSGFYGQLAAERAGLPMDAVWATGGPDFPDWRGAAFTRSSVFAAADLLFRAGERVLATRFLLHLAEGLDARALGQLSEHALARGEPYAALAIAKQAAERGVILPRAYFPVTELARAELGIPPELALAIARRESEFNPEAVSPAGALGLMQLMPGTAEEMAKALGVAYARARLTSDPAYNARLGAAYLRKLLDEFGPNPVLVAAAYNAGPRRPREWMAARGHPGDPAVDAIDWIELIPFAETRTYVMRVAESLPIYRARLSGRTAALRLSAEIAAR